MFFHFSSHPQATVAAFAASEGQGHPRLVEMEKVCAEHYQCSVCSICSSYGIRSTVQICLQNALLVGSLKSKLVLLQLKA